MKPFTERVAGCCEVGLMVLRECESTKPLGDTPEAAAAYWRAHVQGQLPNPDVETMTILLLNTRRRIKGHILASTGTGDTLLIHPTLVFRPAILASAAAVILVHNHPSGDPSPSEADIKVTRDLIRAGQLLKIEVLDHLVMGDVVEGQRGFSSLRELGYFL